MTIYREAIDLTTVVGRKRWLDLRKPYIGASEVGALFGAHDYTTALKLYLEKRGSVEFPDRESGYMRRGRWFEPGVPIAVRELKRPDWHIVNACEYLFDPDLRLGATPDFYIEGDPRGKGVLQAKTGTRSVFERWQESGPPFWTTLQATVEAMLADAAFAAAACVFVDAYNPDVSLWEFERNGASEDKIRKAVAQFWDDVANSREPGPDYGKDAELIKLLAPVERARDAEVDLSGDNELPDLCARIVAIRTEQTALKNERRALETAIKFRMRDAAVVTGVPDFGITWRTSHYGPKEAYDARVLRITDRRPNANGDNDE